MDENFNPASEEVKEETAAAPQIPPEAPRWNPAPAAPVKERRVGRFTLGITLIASGLVLLATMFWPGFDLFTAVKFAPVILILIGVEILVSVFTAKGCRLKYDFFSRFVCFLLICGSFGAAMVPFVYRNTVLRERMEDRLADDIETDVYHVIKDLGISEVHCDLYIREDLNGRLTEKTTYQELDGYGEQQLLNVTLRENAADVAAFSRTARKILDRLEPLSLPGPRLTIRQPDGKYAIWITSRYQWELSEEQLQTLCGSEEGEEEQLRRYRVRILCAGEEFYGVRYTLGVNGEPVTSGSVSAADGGVLETDESLWIDFPADLWGNWSGDSVTISLAAYGQSGEASGEQQFDFSAAEDGELLVVMLGNPNIECWFELEK